MNQWLAIEIGKRVKLARMNAGMSTFQLAQGLLTRGRIHNIERGQDPPTVETLYRLAAVLRIDARDLLP